MLNWRTTEDPEEPYFADRMGFLTDAIITSLLDAWDHIPILERVAIASDRFANNYWHLTMDVIPRFRFYDSYDVDSIVIPESHIGKRFQNNLFIHAIDGQNVILTSKDVIRVRNPVLAFSLMSIEGVRWLRRTMKFALNQGSKRYYIRRGQSISRATDGDELGGLREDDNFLKVLKLFNFQIVEFGSGEYSVSEQVQMLDEAHIILASHGAHLTNIVYLNPPLTVIEIFGPERYNACYLSIANLLSFNYIGLTSDLLDSVGNIIVDCDKLADMIAEVVS